MGLRTGNPESKPILMVDDQLSQTPRILKRTRPTPNNDNTTAHNPTAVKPCGAPVVGIWATQADPSDEDTAPFNGVRQ